MNAKEVLTKVGLAIAGLLVGKALSVALKNAGVSIAA